MLLVLLLLVPVRVVLRLVGDSGHGVELSLAWRVLLLHGSRHRSLTLPGGSGDARPALPATAPPVAPPTATTGHGESGPAADAVTRSRRATRRSLRDRIADLERAVAVVRQLVARRALRVTHAQGWLEFALRDVGETGRAFGYACALATLLDPLGHLEVRPRWDCEDLLAADLELELRAHPLRTLLVLVEARLHRRRTRDASAGRAPAGGSLAV